MDKNEKNIENDIMVSICCLSYQHRDYITQALDSFLKQDCDFRVEILIHDDASKDGTREIIERYADRYGDVIRPLYEEENQYQKGIRNLSGVYNFPRARGKYIAMCEGDDFWLDIRKLSTQVAIMEDHPECSMCCHAARIVSMDDSFRELAQLRPYHNDGFIETEDIISRPVNIPTSSLLFRTEYAKELPDWYYQCPVGDIPLHLFMALKGRVFYINRPMSAYRVGGGGSWSSLMDQGDQEQRERRWQEHFEAMERLYLDFDRDSGGRYEASVREAIAREAFKAEINKGHLEVTRLPENDRFFHEMPAAQRSLVRLQLRFPRLYARLQSLWYRTRRRT